jgi:hypothetical protein
MRRVIIHKSIGVSRADIGTEAYFHCWGSESNEGAGADTIAILEKDDGAVIEAYPEMIRFLEPFATTAKLAATPAGIARACGMENEVEAAQEVSATNPPKGWRLAEERDMIGETSIQWASGFDGMGRWRPVPNCDFGEFFACDWNGTPAVKIEVAP